MRLSFGLVTLLLASYASAQVWEKPIGPGLTYRMEVDLATPRVIHALRYSLNAPDAKLQAELAGGTINESGTIKGRLAPSKMRADAGAVAALNADFFSFDHGAPVGLMVRDTELVTTPFKSRAVFAWGDRVSFGMATWSGHASIGEKELPLDAVNQVPAQNRLHLLTAAFGEATTPQDGIAVILQADGKLKPGIELEARVGYVITGSQPLKLAPDQMVLVARGNRTQALSSLKPGDVVTFRVDVGGFDWMKSRWAVGGGPFLVSNGAVHIDAIDEGFNAAFIGRNPRTAVGRTAQGDLWFVAIDGRQPMSVGATLEETAKILMSLGCTEGMNLDGGGSTNLNILGVTVNRPSDKAERPVSNALLFFTPQPAATPLTAQISPAGRLAVGETKQLWLLVDGKAVRQSEVIWGSQGAAWIDQGGLLRTLEPGKATITAWYKGAIFTSVAEVGTKALAPDSSGKGDNPGR